MQNSQFSKIGKSNSIISNNQRPESRQRFDEVDSYLIDSRLSESQFGADIDQSKLYASVIEPSQKYMLKDTNFLVQSDLRFLKVASKICLRKSKTLG